MTPPMLACFGVVLTESFVPRSRERHDKRVSLVEILTTDANKLASTIGDLEP